eukprot:403340483
MKGSAKIMNLIAVYGAGLIVGAALLVIIPEGMTILSNSIKQNKIKETFDEFEIEHKNQSQLGQVQELKVEFENQEDELINKYAGTSLLIGFAIMLLIDQGAQILQDMQLGISRKEHNLLDRTASSKKRIIKNSNTKDFLSKLKQKLQFKSGQLNGKYDQASPTIEYQQLKYSHDYSDDEEQQLSQNDQENQRLLNATLTNQSKNDYYLKDSNQFYTNKQSKTLQNRNSNNSKNRDLLNDDLEERTTNSQMNDGSIKSCRDGVLHKNKMYQTFQVGQGKNNNAQNSLSKELNVNLNMGSGLQDYDELMFTSLESQNLNSTIPQPQKRGRSVDHNNKRIKTLDLKQKTSKQITKCKVKEIGYDMGHLGQQHIDKHFESLSFKRLQQINGLILNENYSRSSDHLIKRQEDKNNYDKLENFASIEVYEYSELSEQERKLKKIQQGEQIKKTMTVTVTTLGLVLHNIADGLALGTSLFLSTKSESASNLGLLIFFAILLHKIPASIGFGAFLYHEGLRNWDVAKYLLAFTISCPVTSILAYFGLLSWDREMDQQLLMFWVGILLLVSAGSFLYVATIHILPEVFSNTDTHKHNNHHHLPEDQFNDEQQHYSKPIELLTIIIGLVTPYLLILSCE